MVDTIDSINDLICNVKEAMKPYFYNKTESDTRYSQTSHNHDSRYYTETEVDGLLNDKADEEHSHIINDVTGLNDALDSKASSDHNHDSRYYTETEIDTKLSGKADTTHTHSISNVTGLNDALESKASSTHNHDNRYYTETESDAKYALKTHNHDTVYAGKGDLNNLTAKYKKTDAIRIRLIRTDSNGARYPQDDEISDEGTGLDVNTGDKLTAKLYTTDNSINIANQNVRLVFGTTIRTTTTDNNGIARDMISLNNQQDGIAYAILKGTNTFNKNIDIKYISYNSG